MAAAYLYHIARNHPCVDDSKRTALASALVFLHLTGITVSSPRGSHYDLAMQVAK